MSAGPLRPTLSPRILTLILGPTFLVATSRASPKAAQPPVSQARLLVISDVDDTIKDTRVTLSRSTHLKNPLLLADYFRHWTPVRGMPELYQEWQRERKAVFAYVSGGPLGYEKRLETFIQKNGFPDGQIFLNPHFPTGTAGHKDRTIEKLLAAHPRARVILLGDSGEHDPAIYAKVLARHPDRIAAICIRAVTKDAARTVAKLDQRDRLEKWMVFKDASDLDVEKLAPTARGPRVRK